MAERGVGVGDFELAAAEHLAALGRSLALEHERLATEREAGLRATVEELRFENGELRRRLEASARMETAEGSRWGAEAVLPISASCDPAAEAGADPAPEADPAPGEGTDPAPGAGMDVTFREILFIEADPCCPEAACATSAAGEAGTDIAAGTAGDDMDGVDASAPPTCSQAAEQAPYEIWRAEDDEARDLNLGLDSAAPGSDSPLTGLEPTLLPELCGNSAAEVEEEEGHAASLSPPSAGPPPLPDAERIELSEPAELAEPPRAELALPVAGAWEKEAVPCKAPPPALLATEVPPSPERSLQHCASSPASPVAALLGGFSPLAAIDRGDGAAERVPVHVPVPPPPRAAAAVAAGPPEGRGSVVQELLKARRTAARRSPQVPLARPGDKPH